jgi:hypothetical protein
MKTSFVSLCILTATLFAGSAFAQGEGPAAPAAPGEDHPFRQRLLERFDTNHDGQLDATERAAARAEWQMHRAGEKMRARFEARRKEVLARFDRNGDGHLDEIERQELRQAWQDFLQQHPVVAPTTRAGI